MDYKQCLRHLLPIYKALCNPVSWVCLLGPVAVQVALRLAQTDFIQMPAGGSPIQHDSFEALMGSPELQTVLDYSLQIYTVVLAFTFWVGTMFVDKTIVFSQFVSGVKVDSLSEEGSAAFLKSLLYLMCAIVIFGLLLVFFPRCGHLSIVKLYEVAPLAEYPWYSNWFFKMWHAINGPPWSSPLTWMRGLLMVHGFFRNSYREWQCILTTALPPQRANSTDPSS